MKTSLAGLVIG